MKKTSIVTAAQLLALQALAQAFLVQLGATLDDACLMVCGVLVLLPLYSTRARAAYSQAMGALD